MHKHTHSLFVSCFLSADMKGRLLSPPPPASAHPNLERMEWPQRRRGLPPRLEEIKTIATPFNNYNSLCLSLSRSVRTPWAMDAGNARTLRTPGALGTAGTLGIPRTLGTLMSRALQDLCSDQWAGRQSLRRCNFTARQEQHGTRQAIFELSGILRHTQLKDHNAGWSPKHPRNLHGDRKLWKLAVRET